MDGNQILSNNDRANENSHSKRHSTQEKLQRLNLEVFETFPGAAQDLLGIPRKQRGLPELQQSLLRLGCKGDITTRDLTGDELDSINCALVAKDYAEGSYLAMGTLPRS